MGCRMTRPWFLAAITIASISTATFAQDDWHFVDETSTRLPDTMAVGIGLDGGDVNGDGALDILVGCIEGVWPQGPGFEQLYFNDRNGYFSLGDSSMFPQIDDGTNSVLLFDCDNNGTLDAYVINAGRDTDYLAINDGAGRFTIDWSRIPPDSSTGLGADYGDINGDGNIDICMLGNAVTNGYHHKVWVNDGTGHFTNQLNRLPTLNEAYLTVRFADIDGDLDLDLLVMDYGNIFQPRILINDGNGYFTDETAERLPPVERSYTGEFVDIDGDGDFDIVLSYIERCGFLINDGTGHFVDETELRGPLFSDPSHPTSIRSFDADNDGQEDIVLGTYFYGRPDLIFMNSGGGFYGDQTALRWPNQAQSTQRVFLGDFDGDGVCDIFRVGDGYCRNSIFINTLEMPDWIAPAIKNVSIIPNINPNPGPYAVKLVAKDGVSIEYQLAVSVYYSIDGFNYLESHMHYVGGYMFYGNIPAVDSGSTVRYYYTAADKDGNIRRFPSNAPDSVLSFVYLPDYTGISENGDGINPGRIGIRAFPNPFNSSTIITIFRHGRR